MGLDCGPTPFMLRDVKMTLFLCHFTETPYLCGVGSADDTNDNNTFYLMNSRLSFFALLLFAATHLPCSVKADDWMGRIPDETYVSQLSIPGAHDAGTGHGVGYIYGFISGEKYARTQDKTLTEMWNNGVRAFDLRPSVDGNRLHVYHGIVSTNLYFDDALTTLCSLLDEHPTELAIVLIRHETEGDDNSSEWNGMMKELLGAEPVKSHAVNFTAQLKMKNVRGKLLVLCRDEYGSTPTGGFIRGWSSSSVFNDQKNSVIVGKNAQASCYIQDFYECAADGAKETKRQSILTLLRFTTEGNSNSKIWAINHTSGYSITESILGYTVASSDGNRDNAATQNQAVIDFLADHSGPTGLVMMDFAATDRSGNYDVKGQALTHALIENNFRKSDYARGLEVIATGKTYNVFTIYNHKKYYLTEDGYLTRNAEEGGHFIFRKVKGEEYGYGFKLMSKCFTNPGLDNGTPILNSGHINTNTQTNARNTWEAQVFLEKDGKFAVRATNAFGGDSSWALTAKTFWTVNDGADGPVAEYSFDKQFIWELETYVKPDAVEAIPTTASSSKTVFDLSGRRITKPVRGLFIANGRKVVVK